jgi:YVTN family beta-propeller protein
MKKLSLVLLIAVAAIGCALQSNSTSQSGDTSALEQEQVTQLPNVAGRIDHMALDSQGGRLFVAALGNNTVEVIDLKAGKVTDEIQGLKEPQGVAYVPEDNKLLVTNGDGDSLDISMTRNHSSCSPK